MSEVAENQLRQLEESLSSENLVLRLNKLLTDAERRRKNLSEHRERLLQNVVDREEEVVEKVKLWRMKITEKILNLAEKQQTSLGKDEALLSTLLQYKRKGLDMGMEREGIQIFLLSHGFRNLISDKSARRYCVQSLENIDFRIENFAENLFDLFGKLIDETEDMSSDTYHEEEGEKEGEEEHDDDDDAFYDSLDLKMSMIFKFCSDSVENIVPLGDSKTLMLIQGKVCDCDVKTRDLHNQVILSNVLQISLIPSCGDVLSIMRDQKQIKRITKGKLVTTYAKSNNANEVIVGVGAAGEHAYACIAHDINKNKCGFEKLTLLDEFGRILKSLNLEQDIFSTCRLIFCSDEKSNFFRTYQTTVRLANIKEDNIKTVKTYRGFVGTSPLSAFIPNDIAIDHNGRLLVAVSNDNAVHLLDKNLTFLKLLMTEEDGLERPTSVALDTEGYLYVGCKDGQIHVVNYQYFLNTNRLTRLNIEQFG